MIIYVVCFIMLLQHNHWQLLYPVRPRSVVPHQASTRMSPSHPFPLLLSLFSCPSLQCPSLPDLCSVSPSLLLLVSLLCFLFSYPFSQNGLCSSCLPQTVFPKQQWTWQIIFRWNRQEIKIVLDIDNGYQCDFTLQYTASRSQLNKQLSSLMYCCTVVQVIKYSDSASIFTYAFLLCLLGSQKNYM